MPLESAAEWLGFPPSGEGGVFDVGQAQNPQSLPRWYGGPSGSLAGPGWGQGGWGPSPPEAAGLIPIGGRVGASGSHVSTRKAAVQSN